MKGYVEKFESLSRNGKLITEVKNTGSISSKYTISVTQCSSNINPVLGKSIQLNSQSNAILTFEITTNSQLSSENECFVRLYDSEGDEIDILKVKFDTTETTHVQPVDPNPTEPIGTNDPTTGYPTFINAGLNFLSSLFNCKCQL